MIFQDLWLDFLVWCSWYFPWVLKTAPTETTPTFQCLSCRMHETRSHIVIRNETYLFILAFMAYNSLPASAKDGSLRTLYFCPVKERSEIWAENFRAGHKVLQRSVQCLIGWSSVLNFGAQVTTNQRHCTVLCSITSRNGIFGSKLGCRSSGGCEGIRLFSLARLTAVEKPKRVL